MALLDRIAATTAPALEAVTRAADPVTMEEFGYLLAGRGSANRSKSGVAVGPLRVLGITAWGSGVRYLSETVSGLPWHHYLKLADDERQRREPFPWMARPDLEQHWLGLVEHWMMSLLHHGNGYAFKVRNVAGQVVGLRELFPDRITVGVAPDGRKRFLVDHDPTVFTTREILHIPGLAYNGRIGLNPIRQFGDALGSVAAADDYAGRWFAGGTHVGGLISVPQELTQGEADRLRVEWDAFHAGLVNAHKTAVLSKGAKYERISLTAADAQLLETRQYGIAEIARILRITPHKLYDLTHATFSNVEHLAIEASGDSIAPWVRRIEAAINADTDLVPPGHYVEASLEGMLRGDSVQRAAFYTAGINAGWLTPGMAARLENKPSPPELDYYLRPLNMAVLGEHDSTPGDSASDPGGHGDDPMLVAEAVQKVYLGVTAGLITADEGRQIVNAVGGNLTIGKAAT